MQRCNDGSSARSRWILGLFSKVEKGFLPEKYVLQYKAVWDQLNLVKSLAAGFLTSGLRHATPGALF